MGRLYGRGWQILRHPFGNDEHDGQSRRLRVTDRDWVHRKIYPQLEPHVLCDSGDLRRRGDLLAYDGPRDAAGIAIEVSLRFRAAVSTAGNSIQNRLPLPGSDSKPVSPFIFCMALATMARPIPV